MRTMTGQDLIEEGKSDHFPVGEGWKQLVLDLNDKLLARSPDYEIAQIKEKYGGLRFYASGFSNSCHDDAYRLIAKAENDSYDICEKCGKPGELRTVGWFKTLCDECVKG